MPSKSIEVRSEHDSMGEVQVPADALYGAQTQRAVDNFAVGPHQFQSQLIKALALVKACAARTNADLGVLPPEIATAIEQAANTIAAGAHSDQFVVNVFQTGSGTSSNMNANEVIARLANAHPNDHVNRSQSSNDVIPSAIHIAAAVEVRRQLIPALELLAAALEDRGTAFWDVMKIGRTHLQDATPLTLGQEFSGYVSQLDHGLQHVAAAMPHLCELALGGTAVGTGLNAHPKFAVMVAAELAKYTGQKFVTAPNKFEALASCDGVVHAHGALKTLAASLMKIANDVRWLASGPRCGIGELSIPENEPGSSIMPGKVNPTQSESLTMACCQVFGNDVAINFGGASGNFELNVFRPLVITNFMHSATLLTHGCTNFNEQCAVGIEANKVRIEQLMRESLMLVTALNPHIGYDKAAQIAKNAHKKGLTLKASALALGHVTEKQFDEWVKPEQMVGKI